MKPEKLFMENFGPFKGKVSLDFSKLENIFLITGETGSGKTTIFDAICFVLYGEVPGSRGEHIARLRSDHAAPDEDCMAALEFSLGETRYYAERYPKYERPRKKGDGFILKGESVDVYEFINGVKTKLSLSKNEADDKLLSLIGLEAEEFFKIVLLPQGAFAEFLKQNTTARREVLGKLFPVEKAAAVKDLAREKTKEAKSRLVEALHSYQELQKRISVESYETGRSNTEKLLDQAKEKIIKLQKEKEKITSFVGYKKRWEDARAQLDDAEEEVRQNNEEKTAIDGKEGLLKLSRRLRPLEALLREEQRAENAGQEAIAEYAEAAGARSAALAEKKDADRKGKEIPALEGRKNRLQAFKVRLVQEKENEERSSHDKSELEAIEKKRLIQEKQAETIKEKISSLKKEIDELEKTSQGASKIENDIEAGRLVRDHLDDLIRLAGEKDKLQQKAAKCNEIMGNLNKQRPDMERRISIFDEEIARLEAEKSESEKAEMAGCLGAILKPGEACPVCGSMEHPRPAIIPESHFSADDKIKEFQKSRRDAENGLSRIVSDTASQKRELQGYEENISQLDREITRSRDISAIPAFDPKEEPQAPFNYPAPLPSLSVLKGIMEKHANVLNKLSARLKICKEAAGARPEKYRESENLMNSLAEAEKESILLTERKAKLAASLNEAMEKLHLLLDSLPPELSQGKILTSAAEALENLENYLQETDGLIAATREAGERANLALASAEARAQEAQKKQENCEAEKAKSSAALANGLSQSGIKGKEALEAALLPIETEEELAGEIENWKKDRDSFKARVEEIKKQLAGIEKELNVLQFVFSLDDAVLRLTGLEAEQLEAEAERGKAFAGLSGLEKDFKALGDAKSRYEELESNHSRLSGLDNDLNGKNPKNMTFDSWLLSRYLREVADYATKRLEKMSESRYSLLLDNETSGRGKQGLDLAVFDAHTGKTRPCATLSGGESFMASISLALGLADSIQNRSGGVRLDAVFIDEGFGSLDEGTLDKALSILDELQSQRMVGLISHVGEMKSRIPCRVEVIKSASGSSIE
ncbi:AAA family ATPase [Leadbettera azotonutricia]|uniref:DNA repair exonuclease, SbcC n=1 Tax=Leadbettera azotonutricia (strain ATCC BAA-888 / DSM 13862 / ZAS-9) TaxID=545695 RepID=F5YCE3_LEAAZ|nr:AAA family ATPase [Leadbettera azotonutricia]AEF81725.1 DNA repair exonuclease, SbcC [Leadbettera azotonutricia ZAS-9]